MIFHDRAETGRNLAEKLAAYADRSDVLVLALPRGGVPVAYEVARALHAPLDVFVVRKLGVPGHEELALGAIASGGVRVLNEQVVSAVHIDRPTIDALADAEGLELNRREQLYRGNRPAEQSEGRIVILIDDGLATGSSMRAAVEAVRKHKPARLVVAVPIGARETCAEFADEADEVICAQTPEPFYAVGLWYEDFSQTTDDEVRASRSRRSRAVCHDEKSDAVDKLSAVRPQLGEGLGASNPIGVPHPCAISPSGYLNEIGERMGRPNPFQNRRFLVS